MNLRTDDGIVSVVVKLALPAIIPDRGPGDVIVRVVEVDCIHILRWLLRNGIQDPMGDHFSQGRVERLRFNHVQKLNSGTKELPILQTEPFREIFRAHSCAPPLPLAEIYLGDLPVFPTKVCSQLDDEIRRQLPDGE